MLELLQFLPTSLVEFLNSNNPSRRVAVLLKVANVANAIAKELISKKSEVLLEGKGKKDLMSLLGKYDVILPTYLTGAFSQGQCWREPQRPTQ